MDLPDVLRREMHAPNPLLEAGDHVLVAVSGGPDSLALLHALHHLRAEIGLRELSAAHFNHGLRGREADGDAAFVAGFCAAHGIACYLEKADIAAEAARAHVSVQEAARTARYAFFARAAQQCGAGKVATGHTQDDQVETVLLHILRGTGLDGLRGIPARRGSYVRPLLGVTRAQVEAYCAVHALVPRRDSSNSDSSHYTRNRIRHELLPLLEQDYSPGTRNSLLRLSQIAGADADFLQTHARAVLEQVTLADSSSPARLTLSRAGLRALHPALLRHVLRAAVDEARGTTAGITHRHWEQMCAALLSPRQTGWEVTTPTPHWRIAVQGDVVTLVRQEDQPPREMSSGSVQLEMGGRTQIPGSGGWIQAALLANSPLPLPTPTQAVFDARQVHLPSLHVRFWQPGDRIAPRGMAGHTKKLQDIFTNAKVPRPQRSHVPLVADQEGLLWAAGLAAAERGRVTQATQECLVLTASFACPPD